MRGFGPPLDTCRLPAQWAVSSAWRSTYQQVRYSPAPPIRRRDSEIKGVRVYTPGFVAPAFLGMSVRQFTEKLVSTSIADARQ